MSARFSARCLWLAAACAGLSSPPVRAQLTAGTQLDPVVVTTIGYPQPLADSIAHSTVLTREDIERSQAVDLPSLLAREAGLQMTRNGGRGAATTLFLRGAPSSQVLLLIDGVPQTRQDATGALSVEHLMLDQVDRVEVVRGNVSAPDLYLPSIMSDISSFNGFSSYPVTMLVFLIPSYSDMLNNSGLTRYRAVSSSGFISSSPASGEIIRKAFARAVTCFLYNSINTLSIR